MKHIPGIFLGLVLWASSCCSFVGCTAPQQTVAYKSLYTIETTAKTSFDAYCSGVVQGIVSTNGLPTVSHVYNGFQAHFLVALDAVQYNTNAIAPAALVTESQDVVNVINYWRNK